MRKTIPAVVMMAVLAAQPVFANQTPSGSTSLARASEGSRDETVGTTTGEKVICRSDKEIGSRVRAKRICMTSKQWAEKAAEERQFVEQRQAQRTFTKND